MVGEGPGALPYLTLATLCVTLTPLPASEDRGSFSRGGVACDTRAAPKPTTATNETQGNARERDAGAQIL